MRTGSLQQITAVYLTTVSAELPIFPHSLAHAEPHLCIDASVSRMCCVAAGGMEGEGEIPLPAGLAVSAKYRGCYCEATILKVVCAASSMFRIGFNSPNILGFVAVFVGNA